MLLNADEGNAVCLRNATHKATLLLYIYFCNGIPLSNYHINNSTYTFIANSHTHLTIDINLRSTQLENENL